MTEITRRDFLRRGSLWVAGTLIAEPVIKRLWAFPTNPLWGGKRLVSFREYLVTNEVDVRDLTIREIKYWRLKKMEYDMKKATIFYQHGYLPPR